MTTSEFPSGSMGAHLERVGPVGSFNGIVQDPDNRRDIALYGKTIVIDGTPVRSIAALAEDATDLLLTGAWQRVAGCNAVMSDSVGANNFYAAVALHVLNTGGTQGTVELGLSVEAATPPTTAGTMTPRTSPPTPPGIGLRCGLQPPTSEVRSPQTWTSWFQPPKTKGQPGAL